MCLETMGTNAKHIKTDCLRKTTKPGSKLGWKLLGVLVEDDEALKRCRAAAVKATVRKYLRREQRRAQLAKLARLVAGEEAVSGKKKKEEEEGEERVMESRCEEIRSEACAPSHPAGAMAPENTTQYLMSNVYEDLKLDDGHPVSHGTFAHLYGDFLSPSGVYSALDSGYESCLDFQRRDFEEAFDP